MTVRNNEEIESVFHYTTAEGLQGILISQTLWATDFRHLNDLKELNQAESIICSIIKPVMAKTIEPIRQANPERESKAIALFGSYENSINYETRNLFESLFDALKKYVFVLSLCVHNHDDFTFDNGILSMWRAYGQQNAYAIELDFDTLGNHFRDECRAFEYTIPIIGGVVYDHGLKHTLEEFDENLKPLTSLVEKMLQAMRDGTELPKERVTVEEFSALVDILTRVKHRGFKEENELRIAAYIQDRKAIEESSAEEKKKLKPAKTIHYHKAQGFKTIPRIHIFEGLNIRLPIKRIIVGPHENKETYAEELREWLASHEFDIPVTTSQIPFRGMQ